MNALYKISIEHVFKRFVTPTNEVQALEDITLDIADGEFVCLVGPSGCGKSTLLNLIAGLDFPDKGTILTDGRIIAGPGSDRMVMFQEPALFPWLNVKDNVLFGLNLKAELSSAQRLKLAHDYLDLVGLRKFEKANVHELSGGMKQRAALARALAPDPQVLLMDEPFAALDAMTREHLYDDMQRIWQLQKKTIVFVTHNVSEAVCLGDRVVLFSKHPGRIIESFSIKLERPRDIRSVEVARFASRITHMLKGSS